MKEIKLGWLKWVLVALPLAAGAAMRPPSVPLVSVDPFFSVWSPADRLTDAETVHWAGAKQPISVVLEADGKCWRLCGAAPANLPALPQRSLEVRPTQSVYTFGEGALAVELRFSTAKLAEDLEIFSRPVTYVTAKVKGAKSWKLRASISSALATNDDRAPMVTNRCTVAGLPAVSIGRRNQRPLAYSGDCVRCDWGWAWLVGPSAPVADEAHFILAYDDIASIQFFGDNLPAWWRRNGMKFTDMLAAAEAEREHILARLDAFDAELRADLEKLGGPAYADLACLAYRQSFAACKLVADRNGQPLYFSKENNSNGCIGTVDVLYPQFPHLLLLSPTLARATLAPVLLYASHPRWPWPFAPHDLGRYPLANKQRYGGGETAKHESRLMPVEECGNMIIALAALAEVEGTAEFASAWWPTVTKWAQYLEQFGFDPGNQLCTDDFAGHLAHNANLAVKSIVALAAYGRLARMRGDFDTAERYARLAQTMVPKWMEAAKGGKGGGYRLAYDRPGTWSMKYNLVWDRILGLDLFPASVADAELKAYRTLGDPFGLPLDNRRDWTKADWIVWSATLTGRRADFDALIAPLYRFVNETPDREPFSDWYWTKNAKHQHFRARSVIGGVFIPALYDRAIWRKYAARDRNRTQLYAPISRKVADKVPEAKRTFKLASFNLRCPADKGDNAWANRLPRILKVIADRGFDILGVQEATPMQRQALCAALPGWGYIGLGRLPGSRGEACGIFYRKDRFECLGEDNFWLSATPRVPGSRSWQTACPRICTHGRFRDLRTGAVFSYFNTHLDHISNEARVKGMETLLDEIRRTAQGETVFLTGDMNSSVQFIPEAERAKIRATNGPLLPAVPGVEHPILSASRVLFDTITRSETPHEGPFNTCNGYREQNACRIDYVFATGNVRVLRHETCADRPGGKFPSDHDAVAATVEIR